MLNLDSLHCLCLDNVKSQHNNGLLCVQKSAMLSIFRNIRCFSLNGEFQRLRLCVALILMGTIVPVQAQPAQALGAWKLSSGWQNYSESQMNLKGPELGVHWQSQELGTYTLEADAHVGLQNYSSAESGRLDSVLNLDTRWRALKATTDHPHWRFGLALHSHANFLRGTTSLGFGGYDRLSAQLWLPVRWHSAHTQPWAIDAGWLLWGQHMSRLSQVNARFQDVTNTQRRGVYLQISKKVHSSWGELEPYARWAWVDDSDVQVVNAAGQASRAYEPDNTRLQVGVKWQFR